MFGIHGEPFHAATLYRRADRAWRAAGLGGRLRLHQARHTYASYMIAAGVNAKALPAYMGHSSIKVTFDLYGHLFPGSRDEARARMDAYLDAELAGRQRWANEPPIQRPEATRGDHRNRIAMRCSACQCGAVGSSNPGSGASANRASKRQTARASGFGPLW